MWRHRPTFEAQDASGCDLWFRFDFLVEANIAPSDDDATRAIKRRAEQHLAPQFFTVWVNAAEGATLQPPNVLLEDYRNSDHLLGRDFNLNPRRWQTLQMHIGLVPWLVEWRRHCLSAASSAQTYIAEHDLVQQKRAKGLASLRHQHATRVAQLESRLTRLSGAAQSVEQRDLEDEDEVFARLSEAIRVPSIRTDVAGAVFMSATSPFAK
jgi:hypothetical protein